MAVDVDLGTLADLPFTAAERHAPRPAQRAFRGDRWEDTTFAELAEQVADTALGLVDLGVAPGDRVALLSHTRPEWTVANLAVLAVGAVSVSIYQTNSPEECRHVLAHSGARAVVVEDAEQLRKVQAVADTLPDLHAVVVIDPAGTGEATATLEGLQRAGRELQPALLAGRRAAIRPEDPAISVYTSGTTGLPKGVVLTHANYRAMIDMVQAGEPLDADDVAYLFLPLAHVFALLIQFAAIDQGATLAYWRKDPKAIVADLQAVRPTYFPSVPRIFEKLHAAATAGKDPRWLARAVEVGLEVRRREEAGEPVDADLRREHDQLDQALFAPVRGLLGGRIRACATGAAPIARDVLELFWASGVPVYEGYGMTETSTSATSNLPGATKLGTVGRPWPGVEVRIADDGEVLIRGANVFAGYHADPAATAEALRDGWLHTGDLGSLDADGFLSITGRKKDIIITAGGKNIAPALLENPLRAHPLVSQAVVIGDRRPYLVCLVTLDPEAGDVPAEQARAEVQQAIDAVNATVGPVEQIKRFTILPEDLTQEAGELTPTLKVKRQAVAERHAAAIDALYR